MAFIRQCGDKESGKEEEVEDTQQRIPGQHLNLGQLQRGLKPLGCHTAQLVEQVTQQETFLFKTLMRKCSVSPQFVG